MCLELGIIFEKADPLIEGKHASEVLAAKPPFSRARIRNSLPQCALT